MGTMARATSVMFSCVCDLVPLLVMTAGLTENEAERDGALIEVRADVHNADGVEGWAAREAVLSTEDL